ncbi:MAG: FecR domain-containing protein [Acidovorax sp.]
MGNATSSANPDSAPSRAALREAAQWLVRLNSGQARPADRQALAAWRAQDAAHEAAWQRAERLSRTFGAVPAGLGMPVLAQAERTAVNRRAALRVLALVGTVAPAAYLGWRHTPWQQWTAEHRTATGEQRSVTLADGSEVLLNTASALDVVFDANERLLRLRAGEVLVTTAKDSAARAFRVETPGGWLRALGTRFAVRLVNEDTVYLAVTEGAVEITPRHGAQRVVQAGEQCRFTAAGIQAPVALGEQALAWVQGVLYADGMRLDDFAAELARYRPGVVRCDPAVAGLRISGAFQLQDTEYILAMLRETLPVQVVTRTRYWVTLVPA